MASRAWRNPARRAALLTALIPVAASATAIGYALHTQRWGLWGVAAMPARTPAVTSFADLANITATADCLRARQPVEACDPYGRPFQPYVVRPARLLAWAGWGTSQAAALGASLALLTVGTVAGLALAVASRWRRSLPGLCLAQGALGLLAISPPVMLGVERGQVEQVTLALVVAALVLLRTPPPMAWLGAALSLGATASKYFSVGMFLPFAVPTSWRHRRWTVLAAMAASGAFLVTAIPEIRQAVDASHAGAPQTSRNAFGLSTALATLLSPAPVGFEPPPSVAARWGTLHAAGLVGFLLLVAVGTVALRRRPLPAPTRGSMVLLLGGGGVLVLPYLLGSSHDYRLVFLLPLAAGCALWIGEDATAPPPSVPSLVLALCVMAALGGTSMPTVPGASGLPKAVLVLADLSLAAVLALVLSLWLRLAVREWGREIAHG